MLNIERLKSHMSNRRGNVKYICPHCNELLMVVAPSGVGVPNREGGLVSGWIFSTNEEFPDFDLLLDAEQKRIPHEVVIWMGDCKHCGGGCAMLDIKVSTHFKYLYQIEEYPNESTYLVTKMGDLKQWAMLKEKKRKGYTQSHWNGLYPMNMSVNAGPDNLVFLGVDVKAALGDRWLGEVEALIKDIWTPIVEQLPAYTEKRKAAV